MICPYLIERHIMKVFPYQIHGIQITVLPCTIRQYELIKNSYSDIDIITAANEIIANNAEHAKSTGSKLLTIKEIPDFCVKYILWAESEKAADETLQIPYAPSTEKPPYYVPITRDKRMIADYTGLDFKEIESLDIFTYWLYLRDSFVWSLNCTESGRKYLEDAYYYSTSKTDREALRGLFGGSKNGK